MRGTKRHSWRETIQYWYWCFIGTIARLLEIAMAFLVPTFMDTLRIAAGSRIFAIFRTGIKGSNSRTVVYDCRFAVDGSEGFVYQGSPSQIS
ncbi:hypothetical protein BDD12DRAFT_874897 [Trichophaea hybrida]|nr:hypothetical protein BDD12DRAFT_874897 [Trichophaea hybrida]